MVILFIRPSETLDLSKEQVIPLVDRITSAMPAAMVTTIEHNPVALRIRMDYVPDEQEILEIIVKAFEKTGIRDGWICISLTEYSEDDVEEETPPYVEEEIHLADFLKRLTFVTLSIEFCKSSRETKTDGEKTKAPFTDTEIDALGKNVASICVHPVLYYGEIMPTKKNKVRLLYTPQPAENIPDQDILKMRIHDTLQQSGVSCESYSMGAYIKDWGNTLWEEQVHV